jgi:phospholipase C
LPVEHVFVLMLENRSYDHMLGHLAHAGTDARTGGLAYPNGVWSGGFENPWFGGGNIPARAGAPQIMPVSPGHGFHDVLTQLCYDPAIGQTPSFTGPYPTIITNQGFVRNWEQTYRTYMYPPPAPPTVSLIDPSTGGQNPAAVALWNEYNRALSAIPLVCPDPTIVMAGFLPGDLPVLFSLAEEFAVCDAWYSSMPGPTAPNRRFVHAASSAGLFDGETAGDIIDQFLWKGVSFRNGTIFDRLTEARLEYRIFQGDSYPNTGELAGIPDAAFTNFDYFQDALSGYTYDPVYTFIEPDYGNDLFNGQPFTCGNSQHPINDVTKGEALVKQVYETIRQSYFWDTSLLIITYDEHGGFYDHVAPPPATPPGDTVPAGDPTSPGFAFDRFGVRVPAVVISPLTPRSTIDHRTYDHTSILRTLEDLFGLPNLTARDAAANSLVPLVSLPSPRSDAPLTLPEPALSLTPEDCSGLTDTELIVWGEIVGIAVIILGLSLLDLKLPRRSEVREAVNSLLSDSGLEQQLAILNKIPAKTLAACASQVSQEVDPALGGFLYAAMRRDLKDSSPSEVRERLHSLSSNWRVLLYMQRVAAAARRRA